MYRKRRENIRDEKQSGFGLVEVLVSLAIFTMVVLAFNKAGEVALNSWEDAKNKSIAYNIIQDTFECIRNIRDSNFNTPGNNWDVGLDITNIEAGCPVSNNSFTRIIGIDDISTPFSNDVVKKEVTIDVSWKERMGPRNLKSITYLTQWRGKY